MNVEGSAVERELGRAIMPRFHAGFSIGTVAGALVGAAMVALGVSATVHLVAVAAIVAVAGPLAVRAFLPDGHAPAEDGERRNPLKAWTEPRTVLIGVFVFAAAFTEGTGNDWLGVAMIDGYGAAAALGALTFAIFLAAMTLGRWFGPGLIDRHGRVLTVRIFAALALVGLALVVWGSTLPVAMAGAALWGLGTALGFPVGMSAAGDDPAHAPARVSVVATIGYIAFLAGPPLIGFLGEHTGTLRALTVTGGLVALGLLISGVLRPLPVPPRAPAGTPAGAERDEPTCDEGARDGRPTGVTGTGLGGCDRSRVESCSPEMTPAEKAGQLTQYFYFGLPARRGRRCRAVGRRPAVSRRWSRRRCGRGEVGSLLFVTDPAEINRLQRLAVEGNRLGIPVLFGFDVIHGLRTILPVPIAMAASWDPETIERGQAVAAREARAVGIHWAFAPMVDIARDPRWGRIDRGRGRGPVPRRRGRRRPGPRLPGRASSAPRSASSPGPKHFAGYGAALGGRDYDEVNLSDSELWNVYLPPFEAAVEAGAGNVMTAYMDLNGIPGDRQPVAVHRGAARDAGASRASSSATPTPCATS